MSAPEVRTRGARLPRNARRTQLLGAAREVFVAQGYHAAGMDEIAERAGVSKPVLYQHFPSKRDLYLALLEQPTDELVEATREALATTSDNKQRVAATIGAFYAFIDSESESFRLVFESDFTNDPEVRELLERMQRGCAEAAIAGPRQTAERAIESVALALGGIHRGRVRGGAAVRRRLGHRRERPPRAAEQRDDRPIARLILRADVVA